MDEQRSADQVMSKRREINSRSPSRSLYVEKSLNAGFIVVMSESVMVMFLRVSSCSRSHPSPPLGAPRIPRLLRALAGKAVHNTDEE